MTDHAHGDHAQHGHHHQGHQQHGHAHDRGLAGGLRYLLLLPQMWRSPVSDAVVALVQPRPGERVLDLGAGMGPATVRAATLGADVLAVDPTPVMRGLLELRRAASSHRARITVVEGAAESLPVADASLDALWTVNTIHHWASQERAVLEMKRALRPGGRVVLVDEEFDDPAHPLHEAHGRRRAAHGHTFAQVDPVALAELFTQHGFVGVQGGVEQVGGRPAKVVRARRPGG